jgi:hypothetical protein
VSDWATINKGRVREGKYTSEDSDGCNGMFKLFVCSEYVRVIASDGEGWKHVSITRVMSNKVPTWEMMCKIKDLFFEPSDWVIQFHPAHSEYVNNHPGCLHLWKPDAPFPTPPSILTGIKDRIIV